MKTISLVSLCLISQLSMAQLFNDKGAPIIQTANGKVEGLYVSGITVFKGVPYAEPPVGNLRWKEPQPVANWTGVKKADHFSAKAMQLPLYSDMKFRSDGMSEDCLYLNIWTPAKSASESLPVLVYFYGGGLKAGDGSEYRYDGEHMARKGIISITVNYRLGVFGFLSHPDLTKESSHHASGNYGYMDQTEALRWIQKNIHSFGGDPSKVTIAGESAGSVSVCAQFISPLPRNLFCAGIGESGSLFNLREVVPLHQAEAVGIRFAESVGKQSIAAMRGLSAEQILQACAKEGMNEFPIDVDGYFFPDAPVTLYKNGKAARVPLLVGWNSEESGWKDILGSELPTKDNYISAIKRMYPEQSDKMLALYNPVNDSDVVQIATELSSDRRNALGSWRWAEMHAGGNNPVYRYYFTKSRPETIEKAATGDGRKHGAVHSAEIEYALGNLPDNRVYNWTADDYRVSYIMQDYFVNFIKNKNPNGESLPFWPLYQSWQKDPVLNIGGNVFRQPDTRARYIFLDKTAPLN